MGSIRNLKSCDMEIGTIIMDNSCCDKSIFFFFFKKLAPNYVEKNQTWRIKRNSLGNIRNCWASVGNVILVWIIDSTEKFNEKNEGINRTSVQSISIAVSLFLFLLIMHKNQNVLCGFERFRFIRFISSFRIPDQSPFFFIKKLKQLKHS